MTRIPSLPPMPPAEPLDESERALARALRSLPTGTPSPELDARILGAARRSVHMATPRRRDRRWLIGLSTAATAVLAMGVLLKMHGLGHDAVLAPPAETETSAAPEAAAKQKDAGPQAAADALAAESVASDIVSPAPIPSQDESRQVREEQPANAATMPAKESPRAFPATPALQRVLVMPIPPPPPVVVETNSPMAASAPAPAAPSVDRERSADKAALSSDARRDSEADAKSAPAATAAAGGMLGQSAHEPVAASKAESNRTQSNAVQSNAPMQQEKSLDKVTVTGARLKKDTSISLPVLSNDATLNPAEWLERVRERLRSGDRSGAVTSLRTFVHAYPNEKVPADLLPLLR